MKLVVFLIIVTLFSFLIRIFRIGEPPGYYFDEVYHAVTARGYADNNPAAYDPFAPPPKEDTAYDWLHPPLTKLIQAGSIKIFGDVAIGWRLPSVIFGTVIIPATFVLANILFGPTVAIFAALVIAFENLTLVMSRITMNDVFVTFFILMSFIFAVLYVRSSSRHSGEQSDSRIDSGQARMTSGIHYLIMTAIFLGLAVASKWTGAYAIAVIGLYILFQKLKSKILDLKLILLLVVPVFIYLTSYGQFWLQGHTVGQFIDLHKQIWWYQNRHDLEHSYGTTPLFCVPKGLAGPKTWCPWILNSRGVYFSYEQYGGKAGYIYALGNPLIFWVGIIGISFLIGKYLEERKREYLLILGGYFIFWLPWILSPRILFLYHYLPSIPFLSIALGVMLTSIYSSRFKFLAILVVLIFAVTFFYFFPISTGLPIDPPSIDQYMWLKTWR
ncbi:MAG: phospholipid carrier-dependent glycosyltransferase [Patescibacteria group bacterium]